MWNDRLEDQARAERDRRLAASLRQHDPAARRAGLEAAQAEVKCGQRHRGDLPLLAALTALLCGGPGPGGPAAETDLGVRVRAFTLLGLVAPPPISSPTGAHTVGSSAGEEVERLLLGVADNQAECTVARLTARQALDVLAQSSKLFSLSSGT